MPKQIFPQGDNRWLNDDAVIWRYVPLRTLFFYLNGLVFIPSVAKLRAVDPFEGEFYEDIAWFNSAFADQYGNDAGAVDEWMRKELCSDSDRRHIDINKTYPNAAAEVFRRRYFEFIRRTRYAWCWFQSYRESAAMWSVYGNQGVAIQSSVGRLRAAFQKTNLEFAYGRMTYVDYRSGVSGEFDPLRQSDYRLLLRPFFLKRKEFESEQEVRFVTAGSDLDERGGILLKALDPKDWISSVRLWPGLAFHEATSIQKTVKQIIPAIDCQKSDLFSGPDSGLSEFIESFNVGFEQTWTDGSDGIPTPLKSL